MCELPECFFNLWKELKDFENFIWINPLEIDHCCDNIHTAWKYCKNCFLCTTCIVMSVAGSNLQPHIIIKYLVIYNWFFINSEVFFSYSRFGVLWRFRYQVWPRMEDGATAFFKVHILWNIFLVHKSSNIDLPCSSLKANEILELNKEDMFFVFIISVAPSKYRFCFALTNYRLTCPNCHRSSLDASFQI